AVPGVGDIDRAVGADGDAKGATETSGRRRAAVAPESGGARPGERGDDPIRPDAADAGIPGIGDVDRAVGAEGNPGGARQSGRGGRAAVASVPSGTRPGERGDDPVGPDAANAVVVLIRDEQGAVGANGKALRQGELGRGGRAAIAAEPLAAVAAGDPV